MLNSRPHPVSSKFSAAQRLIEIHREIVRLDDDAVRTTQEMFNVGQAGEPEVIQARVQERAGQAWRFRRPRIGSAAIGKSWSRSSAHPRSGRCRSIQSRSRPRSRRLNFDGTLADLLHNSPEIQAALSEIRRDEIMVRRERVEPIPNIQVQAVTGYNYEFGVQTAGVQIGIALPIFNRNQGTIREAMSDLSRDHAELERIALSLRQRLAEVFTRYQDASAVRRGFPRRKPAYGPPGLRDAARQLSPAAHRLAAGDRIPADVFRPQQGLRRIAAGAAASGSRDRRHAAGRWPEPAAHRRPRRATSKPWQRRGKSITPLHHWASSPWRRHGPWPLPCDERRHERVSDDSSCYEQPFSFLAPRWALLRAGASTVLAPAQPAQSGRRCGTDWIIDRSRDGSGRRHCERRRLGCWRRS